MRFIAYTVGADVFDPPCIYIPRGYVPETTTFVHRRGRRHSDADDEDVEIPSVWFKCLVLRRE